MAATTLAQALLKFQAEGVALQKDAINPHFKNRYISLDSLTGTVLPVLNKCGLVVLQMPCESNGVPALTTRIIHAESGESVEATMPLMLQKQDPQSQGSAITYARRYALMSVLGLVADEDTDGHTARPRQSEGSAATQDRSGERPVQAGVVEGAATVPATPANNNGQVDESLIKMRKKLDVLVGRLRPNVITTAELYAGFGRTPVPDADGEIHWAPLRDSLTNKNAVDLLNHLTSLEKQLVVEAPFE